MGFRLEIVDNSYYQISEREHYQLKTGGRYMVYDDLRIAIKRRKRLMAKEQQETQLEMKEWCIGDRISLLLPEQAIEIDDSELKKRYAGYTDSLAARRMPENEADFILQMQRLSPCSPEALEHKRDSMKSILMRLQPANTFYSLGTEMLDSNTSSWFDFDSFGLDGKIYNFLFFTSILDQEEMWIGGFHCKAQNAVSWRPVFIQMMKSLKGLEVRNEK